MRALPVALAGFLLFSVATASQHQQWIVQTSGLDTNLRGVSAVYFSVKAGEEPVPAVWACGSNGVILRSLDQGKTWKRLHVKDGDALDFRGIVALDEKVAYVMSIGNGNKSRIYKTTDGGETWMLEYSGKRKEIFLDAIVCRFPTRCYALGDPIDGKFLLLASADGDAWEELPRDKMPAALLNEGAFAASNSSLFVNDHGIYIATGGGSAARVLYSPDLGQTWSVTETPIAADNVSSGIFSIDARWGPTIFAVGGDYKDASRGSRSAASSLDGGKTWQLSKRQPGGFRSGVSAISGSIAVAVGPSGEEVTGDQGVTWVHTDSLNLNAVDLLDPENGWAVGPNGTIARFAGWGTMILRNMLPGVNWRTSFWDSAERAHVSSFPVRLVTRSRNPRLRSALSLAC